MSQSGFVPSWINAKLASQTIAWRLNQWITNMTAQRENGLNLIKVVVQLVLGTILSALAASAAFTARSLSNHESRLSVVEEWKRDRSEKIDGIARDVAEMRTHNAGVDSQARQTDMLVRDVAAQLRVVSDTLIRMQEGQSAIREKMISLQVMTDELNKGTK